MKKSILLLFAALATLVASAQTKVEIDGIWYNLVSKAKQAEVTYKGDDPYLGGWYSGSITIPATVTHNGVAYSVTSIGGSAFAYCSSLTAINIPEGVTSIGYQTFSYCSSLTSITIPEGVTSIGDYAFYDCDNLTAITIPENSQLTSIGRSAFEGCSSLTAITIPEGVMWIGTGAFSGCSRLTTIVLPKSVRSIDRFAFAGCPELTDVYCYAETVPGTEADAFDVSYPEYATLHVPAGAINSYKATAPWSNFGSIVSLDAAITRITLSQSSTTLTEGETIELTITTTPENADHNLITWSSNAPNVATVDNTGKVTAIAPGTATITATANDGSGVSASCDVTVTSTTKVEIDGIWYNLISKGKVAEVTYKGDDHTQGGWYSGSVTLPVTVTYYGVMYSVTSIGDYAFYYCESLTDITIPEGVTSIGNNTFAGCSGLTSITIPEGVTSIGEEAFYRCESLTSITIPESVTTIRGYAFEDCSSLTAVHISSLEAWCNISFNNGLSNPLFFARNLYLNGKLVTELVISEGVTKIGKFAFYGCSSLTNLTIPESVTTIEWSAFLDCSSLTNITCHAVIPPTVSGPYTFDGVDKSIPIYVPTSSVEAYKAAEGWSEFTNIVSLIVPVTDITLSQSSASLFIGASLTLTATVSPDDATDSSVTWSSSNPSVATVDNTGKVVAKASGTTIITATANDGSGVSASCEVTVASTAKVEIDGIWYNLVSKVKQAEVTFKGDSYNSYWDEYSGSITIPATIIYNGAQYSVTSIEDHAFQYCSLTTITIPEGVTSIGIEAFRGCHSLTSITIPENSQLTSIGDYAFYECRSLTTITIPEGVTSIGESAFAWCSNLTAITIPESVTSIKGSVFRGCSSLTAITIPEGVTSIGNWAFDGCSSLTAITIPEGVTSIGGSAFYNCTSLTDITIPEGVTWIYDNAFYGCSGLTSITIPEGVTWIYGNAFYGCSSLTTIVLPGSVMGINSNAFANCPELTDVYCYAESVPSTTTDAFDGSYPEYATLHVPAGAINSYKATAPWSSFGTIKTIENVTLEKCATPTISYKDGKVVFACDTEGATIKSNVKENIAGDYNEIEFDLIPTYTITAYATKEGYEDSDEATLTLCWVPCEENHEESDGIVTIPSKPVLISTQGGVITLSGLAEGTEIAVVTTGGTTVATATATNGTATLATDLTAGTIAIVKIGNYSIKVAIK